MKVKAYNFGQLPSWHLGAGGDAYIFCDEITVSENRIMQRRQFIFKSLLASSGLMLLRKSAAAENNSTDNSRAGFPLVISTWAPNVKANAAAWEVLSKGGRALDAVEAGACARSRP